MNLKSVPVHSNYPRLQDGRLFVRTNNILETMVKAPLIIAGLMIVALTMSVQSSFGSTRALDLTLYSDGSAHITAQIDVNPLNPDVTVELFGASIDNLVVVGENGFLLSSNIFDDKTTIDTFGSSSITVDYDIHDLVSKDGRIWTFSLDSPTDYSLVMPPNSIIVGMDALPSSMDFVGDQARLYLSAGLSEINYIFGTATTLIQVPTEPASNGVTPFVLIGVVGVTAIIGTTIIGIIIMIRQRQKRTSVVQESKSNSNEIETVFGLRPEMREDDKEIIKFISANGGKVLESDLRRRFLQPRTTMWRAVKRLERQGVIEISKKDMQNLITLKEDVVEEK